MTLYERCPAAGGVPVDDSKRCASNPDGAHRCRRPQDHLLPRNAAPSPYPLPTGASHADHVCSCGFMWVTGEPIQQQVDALNRAFPQPDRELAFNTTDREIRLPVPHDLAADFITRSPVLRDQPIMLLRLGTTDLGEWSIVAVENRYDRERGNHHIATLARRD